MVELEKTFGAITSKAFQDYVKGLALLKQAARKDSSMSDTNLFGGKLKALVNAYKKSDKSDFTPPSTIIDDCFFRSDDEFNGLKGVAIAGEDFDGLIKIHPLHNGETEIQNINVSLSIYDVLDLLLLLQMKMEQNKKRAAKKEGGGSNE